MAELKTVIELRRLVDEGRYAEIIRTVRPRFESGHVDPSTAYYLGLAAYRTFDDDLAAAAFGHVAAEEPQNARACYSLGLALARQGDSRAAATWFQRALEADPGMDRARERLADLDAQRQRSELAHRLDRGERAGAAGALLRSGHRRLSSFGGRFALAALLAVLGCALLATGSKGRSRELAEWWPLGADVEALRRLAELTPPGPARELAEADLARALAGVESRARLFDDLLLALAVALVVLAGILVAHAFLAAGRTRYDVYERRIDLVRGVLSRRHASVWLYEITEVTLLEPARLSLTGNAEVRIVTEDGSHARLVGLGTAEEQRRLWRELRDAALEERRAMKRWWV